MAPLEFPDPPLRDEVVALRGWEDADVPAAIMGFAEPTIQRFSWSRPTPYTEADAGDFLAHQEDARLRGEELNLAFTDPADSRAVLGGGSIYGIELADGRAAVGYWLNPDARGRGVATHATLLMARWAFSVLGIARLELTCAPDNAASQRVAMRCGFTREGLLRSHIPFKGGRRDTVMFSLLARELDRRLAPA